MRGFLKPLSWLAGITGLVVVVYYFGPENIPALVRSLSSHDIAAWVAITLVARILVAETTVAPLRVLNFNMRISDVFWIGWLRTFANQIFPAAGVIAYTHAIRKMTSISWSELAALAAPQFVLVAAALGCVGIMASLTNVPALQGSFAALFMVYCGVLITALAVSRGAPRLADLLPAALAARLRATSAALQKFAERPTLIMLVICCHSAAIVLRGGRMWLLFAASGISLEWNEMLLVVAVAESSMLLQLTPGGLGIREGAVLAAALLVGVPTELAAGVAVLDRLLIIAITMLLTPPAIVMLRGSAGSAND